MKTLIRIVAVAIIILLAYQAYRDRAKINDYSNQVYEHEQKVKALKRAKNALELKGQMYLKELDSLRGLEPKIIIQYETVYKDVETLPADQALENFDTWTTGNEKSELLEGKAIVDTLRITSANLVKVKYEKTNTLLSLANNTIQIQSELIQNKQSRLSIQTKMLNDKREVINLKDSEIAGKDKEIQKERIQKYIGFGVSGALTVLLLLR